MEQADEPTSGAREPTTVIASRLIDRLEEAISILEDAGKFDLVDRVQDDINHLQDAIGPEAELADSVFRAAIGMGYALNHQPPPGDVQRSGQPPQSDRDGAEDLLRQTLDALRAGMGLRGSSPKEVARSMRERRRPAWRFDALANIVDAGALAAKHEPAADRQALDLLGLAVWAWSEAGLDQVTEREVRRLWPTKPVPAWVDGA